MFNTTSAGVEQSKAAYAQVLASIPAIQQSIRETENAMSMLLAQAPQTIQRGVLEEQQLPEEFSVGVPLQLLSNRPDVKAAEMALASTYYNANSVGQPDGPTVPVAPLSTRVNCWHPYLVHLLSRCSTGVQTSPV